MFITFEGPDGSGKTTQARLLAAYLQAQGQRVHLTREPGGSAIGDQIREVLHKLENTAMHPSTEVLLYQASRAQLVNQVIRPQLAEGAIVLCDRYADSTLAYQGYGHGLDLGVLRTLIEFATGGLQPDLTLYFSLSAEAGLVRRQQAAAQGEEFNRLDAYALAFHQRVRAGYETLIAAHVDRWVRIDAEANIESVEQAVRQAVQARLPSKR
jgi:dTMP kinase